MKNILLLLAALVIGVVIYKHQTSPSAPTQVAAPVYGETRVTMGFENGSAVELVVLTQAQGQADCGVVTKELDREFASGPFATCERCTPPKSQCLAALPPRFAGMFANRPGHVTYLSLAAGDAKEREMRMVLYGVPDDRTEQVCAAAGNFQAGRRGKVTCVRPGPN